jgi:hypothetical protein
MTRAKAQLGVEARSQELSGRVTLTAQHLSPETELWVREQVALFPPLTENQSKSIAKIMKLNSHASASSNTA